MQTASQELGVSKTRPTMILKLRDWNDTQNWETFYEAYGGIAYSMATRKGLSPVEAEEAKQDTMIAVSDSIGAFEYDPAKGGFRRWLCTIASRRIAEILRRKMRRARMESSMDDLANPTEVAAATENSVSDDEWEKARLQVIIGNLREKAPPRQVQIFDLMHNQGWEPNRIADELGISKARVHLELFRFRKRIQKAAKVLQRIMPE